MAAQARNLPSSQVASPVPHIRLYLNTFESPVMPFFTMPTSFSFLFSSVFSALTCSSWSCSGSLSICGLLRTSLKSINLTHEYGTRHGLSGMLCSFRSVWHPTGSCLRLSSHLAFPISPVLSHLSQAQSCLGPSFPGSSSLCLAPSQGLNRAVLVVISSSLFLWNARLLII